MNNFVITLDVDWAPDFVLDAVAQMLISRGVRATWFVTHASPAVDRLREHPDLFELGIHPNFLPGSTHGDTPEQVLQHCMTIVPEAISWRPHVLMQSSPILEKVMRLTPIIVDSSLFIPDPLLARPFQYRWHNRTLLRVPYFWDDDYLMDDPKANWNLDALLANCNDSGVIAFHPIHIYLNSADITAYHELKKRAPHLLQSTPEDVDACVHPGAGTQTLFKDLVQHLSQKGYAVRLKDIYSKWQQRGFNA